MSVSYFGKVLDGLIVELKYGEPQSDVSDLRVEFRGNPKVISTIGAYSYLVDGSFEAGSFRAHLLIGRYCSLAHRVKFILGLNHLHREVSSYPFDDFATMKSHPDGETNHAYENNHYQIIIGNDVWIGAGATILGGVRIGNGAVIGAEAVVAKDVPPYAVVVGNPAHVVKYRFPKEIVEKLERIKWWNWAHETILARRQEMKDPVAFAERYDRNITPIKNDVSELLRQIHDAGGKIYEFVLDCDQGKPLWKKVLMAYLAAFSSDDKTMLLIDVPQDLQTHPALSAIQDQVMKAGDKAANVCLHTVQDFPALDSLPYVDVFVTGCSATSSLCVDYAELFGVSVYSGCDYGSHLFGLEKMTCSLKTAVSSADDERAQWEQRIQTVFQAERQVIEQQFQQGQFENAANQMGSFAELLYQRTKTVTDDFLEGKMEDLAKNIPMDLPAERKKGVAFFYDAFGLDLRGLALIYLRALVGLGYHVVYCVDDGHQPLPHIEGVLSSSGGETVLLSVRGKGQLERARAVCAAVKTYAPEVAFLYTTPSDVGGILAFQKLKGHVKRYQINLTDHAFWLGRNAFDFCLEFRDFGATISRTQRKIPAEKLLKQPYYPVIDRKIPFAGYPFERMPGDFVIFSGGQLYKTKDEAKTYYHVVDAILKTHPQVKFWYARGGQDADMDWLKERYPDRFFYTSERKDLYQVLKACDLYLNTYPIIGGLMTQYAAAAGRLPLTLNDSSDPLEGLLLEPGKLDIVRHDVPSFLALVDKLIKNSAERDRRNHLAEKSVITEAQFRENLGEILQKGTSRYPIRPFEAERDQNVIRETFRRQFLQRYGTWIKKVLGEE